MSHWRYLQFRQSDTLGFSAFQNLNKPHILRSTMYCWDHIQVFDSVKCSLSEGYFHFREQRKMAVGVPENEARLTYNTQPFSREFFVAIPSVDLCERNVGHVFSFLRILPVSDDLPSVHYILENPIN